MQIFASWSGPDSRAVAELFKSWIPCVLQDVNVYVSSQDIEKGERWQTSVASNLTEIDFGLIVVTKTNMNAPWILFEAGALSKSVKSRVIPILCGVNEIDTANSPLTQFQYSIVNKEEIKRVIEQINSANSRLLDPSRVDKAFEKWWPDFENEYKKINFIGNNGPTEPIDDSDRLTKIEHAIEELLKDSRRSRHIDELTIRTPTKWADADLTKFFRQNSDDTNKLIKIILKEKYDKNDDDRQNEQ